MSPYRKSFECQTYLAIIKHNIIFLEEKSKVFECNDILLLFSVSQVFPLSLKFDNILLNLINFTHVYKITVLTNLSKNSTLDIIRTWYILFRQNKFVFC